MGNFVALKLFNATDLKDCNVTFNEGDVVDSSKFDESYLSSLEKLGFISKSETKKEEVVEGGKDPEHELYEIAEAVGDGDDQETSSANEGEKSKDTKRSRKK